MEIGPEVAEQVRRLFDRPGKSMLDALGISWLTIRKDEIVATMPVDSRTTQPFGLLHGGASAALAETLASIGGWVNLTDPKLGVVGIEVNANHLRSKTSGLVTGRAVPLHIGSRTHVWEIRIKDEQQRLICISRCTLAVITIPPEYLDQQH